MYLVAEVTDDRQDEEHASVVCPIALGVTRSSPRRRPSRAILHGATGVSLVGEEGRWKTKDAYRRWKKRMAYIRPERKERHGALHKPLFRAHFPGTRSSAEFTVGMAYSPFCTYDLAVFLHAFVVSETPFHSQAGPIA